MSSQPQILVNDQRTCLRAALVIGGVNIMVGVALLVNTQIEEAAGKASLNFAKTTGKVVYTHVTEGYTRDSNVVRYEYQVNGQTFQCARVGFPDHTKIADTRKYPRDKEVAVYYDSHTPAEACLEPGVKSDNYKWNAGVGWFWIGLGFLLVPVAYWFTRKKGLNFWLPLPPAARIERPDEEGSDLPPIIEVELPKEN